ncbi:MAG: hypothetical protein ACI4DY_07290, partial [Monoglobaceae bacterium]
MLKRKVTLTKRLLAVLVALGMLLAAAPVSADGASVTVSVRSGAELSEVKLLDTLVASVSGGNATAYKWQVSSDSGENWTDIDGETSNNYIVSAKEAGKLVCCVATV